VPDTISILRGLKEKYEGHHGVRIQDRAFVVAAQLSSRYISGMCALCTLLIDVFSVYINYTYLCIECGWFW
jgi:ATP-dependent Clp protease ATP-binding subunit ClpA